MYHNSVLVASLNLRIEARDTFTSIKSPMFHVCAIHTADFFEHVGELEPKHVDLGFEAEDLVMLGSLYTMMR